MFYLVLGFPLLTALTFASVVFGCKALRIDNKSFLLTHSPAIFALLLAVLVGLLQSNNMLEPLVELIIPSSVGDNSVLFAALLPLAAAIGVFQFTMEKAAIRLISGSEPTAHKMVNPDWRKPWFISIALFTIVAEEVIWRFYLPGAIVTSWAVPTMAGAFLASISFGLHHVFFGWIHVLLKTIHGIVWFMLFDLSESLLPAIIAHACFNFAVYYASSSSSDDALKTFKEPSRSHVDRY